MKTVGWKYKVTSKISCGDELKRTAQLNWYNKIEIDGIVLERPISEGHKKATKQKN